MRKDLSVQGGSTNDFGGRRGAKCLNVPNHAVKTSLVSLNRRLGTVKKDSRSRGRYHKVLIIASSFRCASSQQYMHEQSLHTGGGGQSWNTLAAPQAEKTTYYSLHRIARRTFGRRR